MEQVGKRARVLDIHQQIELYTNWLIENNVEEYVDYFIIRHFNNADHVFSQNYVEANRARPGPQITPPIFFTDEFVYVLITLDLFDSLNKGETPDFNSFHPSIVNDVLFLAAIAKGDIDKIQELGTKIDLTRLNRQHCLASFVLLNISSLSLDSEDTPFPDEYIITAPNDQDIVWKLWPKQIARYDFEQRSLSIAYITAARTIQVLQNLLADNALTLNVNCTSNHAAHAFYYEEGDEFVGKTILDLLLLTDKSEQTLAIPLIRTLLLYGAIPHDLKSIEDLNDPFISEYIDAKLRSEIECDDGHFWEKSQKKCVECTQLPIRTLQKISKVFGLDPNMSVDALCLKLGVQITKSKKFTMPVENRVSSQPRSSSVEHVAQDEFTNAHLKYLVNTYDACITPSLKVYVQVEPENKGQVIDAMVRQPNLSTFWDAHNECSNSPHRFIITRIHIIYFTKVEGKRHFLQHGHANMLITDKFLHTVERFEPHGYRQGSSFKIDTLLQTLFPTTNYFAPISWCPVGVQTQQAREIFQGNITGKMPGGFCNGWSLWYAHLRLSNPDLTREEIIAFALEKLRRRPGTLTEYIVDYIYYIDAMTQQTK